MKDQETFFKLLKYSNKLKKNNKYLCNENPEVFDLFLSLLVIIECNLHFLEKQEYIELADDFLSNQITADDFASTFQAIYEGINRKFDQMRRDESLELANFLEPSRPELGGLLARIYGSCDSFSTDPEVFMVTSDEKELEQCAKMLLLKLQEE